MSAPAGYFVAPDANNEVWIWRERDEHPVPVISCRIFREDPTLWGYFTSDMPFHVTEETP